jgi:selenocysteine-specific elongation factor
VKALTGIDADRLEEEKRRGITIDIGFAHLTLERTRFGFIDVPGHERFVRNMLAGTGGIDFVLLVIAADEGIKPQTREHFEICRLLNIRRGITVLTKSDAVDPDTLGAVKLEVEEFLGGTFLDPAQAPIIPVSSTTGSGLEELRQALLRAAGQVQTKDASALFRLPIDRVFTMKGFGTVVTGTLLAGQVRKDDEVQIFPSGVRSRVRGVQVHGESQEQASAGERTALNLTGVAKEELARGMSLAVPDCFRLTMRADVRLTLSNDAKPLRDQARVHFHAHTSETIAQVALLEGKELRPGKSSFAQLRFAAPLLLMPQDRFIIRQFSPVVTIGGGEVLDTAPLPKAPSPERSSFLDTMSSGNPEKIVPARVARRGERGLTSADLLAETGWLPAKIETAAKSLARFGDTYITPQAFSSASEKALQTVLAFHQQSPLVAGISKEELRERLGLTMPVFSGVLEHLVSSGKIEVNNEQVRAGGHRIVMKDDEAESKHTIEQAFRTAGLKVPAMREVIGSLPVDKARATKIVTLLLRDRVLVKLADDLVFHREALVGLRQTVSEYKAKSSKTRIDVAAFKELTGVSRKYAIPLLEHLDRERVTRREGNERVIL